MDIFARRIGIALCVAAASGGIDAAHATRVHVTEPSTRAKLASTDADWRRVVTAADRSRLRAWRQAWIDALAKVRAGNEGAAISADAALFDPDRALPGPVPPAGAYLCRVYKLGANGTAMRNVTVYPAVECNVDEEGDVSSFYKVSGRQRPVGLIFRETQARAVFLGTLVLGDETKPLDYGQDQARDLAGYIERIGPQRWRLALPYPRFESLLDVVEIIPATKR